MRVLVLTYYYPPDREVGSLRPANVVAALRAAGHDVQVVAARTHPDSPTDDARRVSVLPSVRQWYGRLRSVARPSRQTAHPDAASNQISPRPRSVSNWKRWIFSLIWLPDDKQGFIPSAIRAALASPDGRPDVIYTTAPPFSVHLAGLLLRVWTGASWVAEFRDPWTSNPWKPAIVRSSFSDWAERSLERLCVGYADLVVPVSEGIHRQLAEIGTDTPIVTIRNGINRVVATGEQGDRIEVSPFVIVYVGSFYHSRDPFPFLDAVHRLITSGTVSSVDFRVRFIGTSDTFDGRSISSHIDRRDISNIVRVEGWLEHEACLQAVGSADALLLLAMDQPAQVPNKLYEYLGTRRPILAVADAEGETATMLQFIGGHELVESNSTALIEQALTRLIHATPPRMVGNAEKLADWTTDRQMASLVSVVGGLDVD